MNFTYKQLLLKLQKLNEEELNQHVEVVTETKEYHYMKDFILYNGVRGPQIKVGDF